MADDPYSPIHLKKPGVRAPAGWMAITPVPDTAPAPFPSHPKLGKPSQRWRYDDADGRLLGYVCRFETKDGKEFRPLTYGRRTATAKPEWKWESWPPRRPLYGLHDLARRPDAIVLVCEGEKACDAARKLLPDLVAVTSPNGAKSAAKADWTALRGRTVITWPDSDAAGAAFAGVVARELHDVAKSVSTVVLPADSPDGWDAADALRDGWDGARALVQRAELVDDLKPPKKTGGRRRGQPPQRGQITELVSDAELWHDSKRTAYITIPIDGHHEHWRVRSHDLRLMLRYRYHKHKSGAQPGGQALEDAIGALEARAIFDGPEHQVFLRTASRDGRNYLDLCDKAWRAVEIDASGWRVIENPPVKFIRTNAMRALPDPEHDDRTIDQLLRPFINVKTDAEFSLLVAWAMAALRPDGPYPILAIGGEAGTAKSSACKFIRALIDPNEVPLRSLPRDDAGLWVGADNCYVMGYDNVSFIDEWLSDSFCRIAHGGGMTVRTLYKDREEESFTSRRPLIFNGIGSLANRSDLSDRSIVVRLEVIPNDKRRTEEEIWADFEIARPKIMAGLLDACSVALRRFSGVKLQTYSRMADFERWMVAAAPGLGIKPDDFLEAYRQNNKGAANVAFEADQVAVAIFDFIRSDAWARMPSHPLFWKGSATELLAALNLQVGERRARARGWPQTPSILGGNVDRAAPGLRARGYEVVRARDGEGRSITITKLAEPSL